MINLLLQQSWHSLCFIFIYCGISENRS